MIQTELVVAELRTRSPETDFRIKAVKTRGDRDQARSLADIGGEGIFVKEIEEELLGGRIDFAVHSLKDMPTELDPRFSLPAVCMRVDARDAFVSASGERLSELRPEAVVGTGSERRSAQIRAFRPDIRVVPLRGNIGTRLRKVGPDLDGIIIAAAAMLRMGWGDRITEFLPVDSFLPAAGQGALAVETTASNRDMIDLLSPLDDWPIRQSVQAERALLKELGGGCRAPIAALGRVDGGILELQAMLGSSDGSRILRAVEEGSAEDPELLAGQLARRLLSLGAADLIRRRGQ